MKSSRSSTPSNAKSAAAKVAAGLALAAVVVVVWWVFERAPREEIAPKCDATAASSEPARVANPETVEAPARVVETPPAAKSPNADEDPDADGSDRVERDPALYATLRGRVLLPDGSVVDRCEVYFRLAVGESLRQPFLTMSERASGRFEFVVPLSRADPSSDSRIRIVASTVVDKRPLHRVVDVPFASQDDLEIQLVDEPRLRVHVLDPGCAAVETYRCSVPGDTVAWSQVLLACDSTIETHLDGRCDFPLPSGRYLVVVDAPGFARGVAGPFETDASLDPPSLDVEMVLKRESPIAGRVVARGRPIAGALVVLNALAPPDSHFEVEGLALSVDPRNGERVTTGADGSFALPRIEAPHGARLWVGARECARAEVTIPVDRIGESNELEIELRPGGTLTGTVTGLDLQANAELERDLRPVVIAERRDIWPRATHLGADGRFRIEHLSPGSWHVYVAGNSRSFTGTDLGRFGANLKDGPEPPPEWNVEIVEGGESSITLEMPTMTTSR